MVKRVNPKFQNKKQPYKPKINGKHSNNKIFNNKENNNTISINQKNSFSNKSQNPKFSKDKNFNKNNLRGKYQTNNFDSNKKNKKQQNEKENKNFYNEELEISNNNQENNFFDFESNSTIVSKLKNSNIPKLQVEENTEKNPSNKNTKTPNKKNQTHENLTHQENNVNIKSWSYNKIINEEKHFLDIKKQRINNLEDNIKDNPSDEPIDPNSTEKPMEIDDELKQLEKDNKKTSITPSLKGELEKRLNIIKAEEDEQSDFDSEDNKYHDKFESEIYSKNMSFCDFNVSKLILKGCSDLEFFHPTKVQEKVIPIILKNDDVFVNSETGSGKTACYLLPIIQKIITNKNSNNEIKALIILPTRELAYQCGEMLKSFVKYVDVSYNLICGGMSIEKQTLELKNQLDIIIATPGRLIDMIYNYRSLSLEFINILVLDEADKLLELGFKDAILEIITLMKNNQNRQTLLFSATLNPKIIDLGKHTLKNPVKIKMLESALLKNLKQKIIRMTFKNLEENEFEKRMSYLIDLVRNKKRTIIFFNTKKECHRAFVFLEKFGLASGELHSDILQTLRLKSLEDFQAGTIKFLLATDIAGRGIDIEKVKCVVNFQMPLTKERYTHRIGRTARKGYSGEAVTICNEKDRLLLKKIIKKENYVLGSVKINNLEIKNIYKILCENKSKINQICEEEEIEKEMLRAEKDVTKAFNVTNYKQDIMNRPRKTWFMNKYDKRNLGEKMKEEFMQKQHDMEFSD